MIVCEDAMVHHRDAISIPSLNVSFDSLPFSHSTSPVSTLSLGDEVKLNESYVRDDNFNLNHDSCNICLCKLDVIALNSSSHLCYNGSLPLLGGKIRKDAFMSVLVMGLFPLRLRGKHPYETVDGDVMYDEDCLL
jgi:hypothetical protein